ncbi:MAG TPA: M28 family peptidase, partial [Phycisphaerales bacterium]|nr:M28 family peptidase [Phycisphaerales bacterium]
MKIRNGATLSAVLMVLFAGGAVSVADGVPGRVLERETIAIVEGKETPVPSIAMGDTESVALILKEGKDNNKVMDHLTYLTKQIGARLTGSTNCETANRWCAAQYESWGLTGVQVEQWGEVATRFDRGPSTMKMVIKRQAPAPRPAGEGGASGRGEGAGGGRGGENGGRGEGGRGAEGGEQPAASAEPQYTTLKELQFTTLAWTRGTNGTVRGPVIWMPETEQEYAKLKEENKLKGAWILVKAPPPQGRRGVQDGMSATFSQKLEARKAVAEGTKKLEELPIKQRIALEGIAGFISASRDERVSTTGAPGWRDRKASDIPEDVAIVVRRGDYDAINSRIADGEPVEIEANLEHTLTEGPFPVYNTIAEIRGSEKPEEVVIVSAHLDSWNGPGSEGCTDNGTGSSVVLEAARILSAAIKNGAKPPKRTIRFINWTGEEQGLLGSKGYIDKRKDELLKTVSACFVDDGGTNYEGGLVCTAEQIDYMAAATAPINNQFYSETDKKWMNVNVKKGVGGRSPGGGSSDHASFNRVGIPGFFWDEVGRA